MTGVFFCVAAQGGSENGQAEKALQAHVINGIGTARNARAGWETAFGLPFKGKSPPIVHTLSG